MVMKSDIQSLREEGPEPAALRFTTVTLSGIHFSIGRRR